MKIENNCNKLRSCLNLLTFYRLNALWKVAKFCHSENVAKPETRRGMKLWSIHLQRRLHYAI